MSDRPVLFEADGGVAVVTLNRPGAANALDHALVAALDDAVTRVAADDTIRVVLLRGSGARFCAGGDVGAMATAPERGDFLAGLADAAHAVVRRIDGLHVPVVAGVHGAVAGAGLALVLSADLVIAGESTRFVSGYAAIGLTPDCGTSWLLPRAVGTGRALELTLTNRALTAAEARDWGIVTRVCADADVKAESLALARSLAAGPARALGRTRRLVRGAADRGFAASLDLERATIAAAGSGAEAGTLIDAFLARRGAAASSTSPQTHHKENHT
ncbi:enoyl-CoA hydratase-related protein [Intrasporangium mesophilum]